MQAFRCLVISLPSAFQRRIQVDYLFRDAGLDFEYLDAVDGRTDTHPLLERFKPEVFLRQHGRNAVLGEVGCYASHYLAWERCVDLNEPMVIFEDDFKWNLEPEEIRQSFEIALAKSNDYPFIRMEPGRKKRSVFREEIEGFTFLRYLKIPQCATCYLISPRAAIAFMKASKNFTLPVDVMIKHQNLHGVPIFQMNPPPVKRASQTSNQSMIGSRGNIVSPWWCEFTRIYYSIKNSILNTLQNIRHGMLRGK